MKSFKHYLGSGLYRIYDLKDKNEKKRIDKLNRQMEPKYECSMCGARFYAFYPFEHAYCALASAHTGKMQYPQFGELYRCPSCGAVNRVRMLFEYLEENGLKNIKDVLYMSPTTPGLNYFRTKYPSITVVTDDLFANNCDYHYDIMDMYGFRDDQFDLVICSHVLEHVKDDIKAVQEMYRVTKKGGRVIVIVPLILHGDEFDESTELSETENWKRFGDATHVRAYSKKSMEKRIKESGFDFDMIDMNSFDPEIRRKNAMIESDVLYVIKKG